METRAPRVFYQVAGSAGILQFVLLALKLTDVIDWPWWLVLLPAIIGMILYVGLVVLVFILITRSKGKF